MLSRKRMLFGNRSKRGGKTMSVSWDEEKSEIHVSNTTSIAFQELEEEGASLEQQRRHLNDQRVLLDLERAELQQQMAAIQLQYAFLEELSAR